MPATERSLLEVAQGDTAPPDGWFAEISASVGSIRRALTGDTTPRVPWEACHPVPISGQIPLTAGAGTLQQKDAFGPKTAHWWDLRRLSVFGFTAGSVSLFRNSTLANPLHVFSAVGDQAWSAAILLGPEDQLIFTATGITGSVTIDGQAVEIETAWLPVYLM